jgi:hypothetical protein
MAAAAPWSRSLGAGLFARLSPMPRVMLLAALCSSDAVPEALVYALISTAFGLLLPALVACLARDAQRPPVAPWDACPSLQGPPTTSADVTEGRRMSSPHVHSCACG